MKTKYLNLNQHISIKGRECEVAVLLTEADGGRKYEVKSLSSDERFEIVQLSDGTIESVKKIEEG